MHQDLTRTTRFIVIAIVLIAAILMIAVLPFTVPDALDKIQVEQGKRIEKFYAEGNPQAPLISATQWLVGFFFPFWTALTIIAGIMLFFLVKPLFNGQKWSKALTLVCLSIPSISGAYMTVPYLNFAKVGIPNGLYFMAVGLIAYFTVVLADKSTVKQKVIDFWVFLILGVTAAESFSNGHAAYRIVVGHPKRPFFASDVFILGPTYVITWISTILLILAIYFIGMRSIKGWYLALFAGAATGLMGFATQYVRTATYDYLYQGLMGLAIVVTFLIPVIKERIINEHTELNKRKNISTGA